MPYVTQDAREILKVDRRDANTAGELNYVITLLLIERNNNFEEIILEVANCYIAKKGLSYQTINDILGAFTGAGLEYVRRTPPKYRHKGMLEQLADTSNEFYSMIAAPYEDTKIKANGDVYLEVIEVE